MTVKELQAILSRCHPDQDVRVTFTYLEGKGDPDYLPMALFTTISVPVQKAEPDGCQSQDSVYFTVTAAVVGECRKEDSSVVWIKTAP